MTPKGVTAESTAADGGGTGRAGACSPDDARVALSFAALEQMSQAAALFDRRFGLVYCNPAAAALLGLPASLTRPGTPMRRIILHQGRQGAFGVAEARARVRDMLKTPQLRMEYQRGDGRIVMVRRDPLDDGGFVVLYNDVTMQRRAEAELQANERRYYAVVEHQTDPIIRFAPDRRITFVNGACCRFYGLRRRELLGRDALTLVHPDERAVVGVYFAELARAPHPRTIEHRAPPDESAVTRWLHRSDRPIPGPEGGPVEFQSVLRDVTELKLAQEQAQRVTKLTTLGQIVAGVTHELNQPLNAAALAAQNALMDIEEGRAADAAYLERKLSALADDLRRMGEIVNHLRTFIRPSPDSGAAADVVAAIRRAVELVGNQFELDAVSFDLRLPDSCAPAAAAAMDIETVLVNLFTNARDAILRNRDRQEAARSPVPFHGRIMVAVEDFAPEEVRIVVRDNGGGIADELIPRVFDPFVTTKDVGKGMGLGLSIVHQTVANLGGTLAVRNAASGAEFRIGIPAARSA